jgi:hypothetical protein
MGRKEISALSHFGGDEIMLVRTEQNRPECDLKDFQKMLGRNPTSQLFRPPNLTFLIKCEAGVNIPPRLIERCYPVERLPLLGFGVWGLQGPAQRRLKSSASGSLHSWCLLFLFHDSGSIDY